MIVVFWMLFVNLQAQNDIDESTTTPIELEDLIQMRQQISTNQVIPINCLTEIELAEIGVFNLEQCKNIIIHRATFGNFIHAQELIQCMIPVEKIDSIFLQLDFRTSFKQEILNLHTLKKIDKLSVSGRLKPPSHSSNISTILPNWGYELKVKINLSQNLDFGASIDNDPGEKRLDFYTGYLQFKGKSIIKNIILGNFICQFNKGLIFGSSGQFGSPISLENYTYQPVGIKPYSSYNEDIGHIGAAIFSQLKHIEIYAGLGQKSIDCQLNLKQNAFINRQFGGIHHSELQIARRHNNSENFGFFAIQKHGKKYDLNFSFSRYQYLIPKQINIKNDTLFLKQLYFFEGQLTVPNFLGGRWILNSAFDFNTHNWAHCAAGVYAITKNFSWGIKLIQIPKEYQAPELNTRLQYLKNKTSIESGFDAQITRKFSMKIRNTMEQPNVPQIKQINLENYQKQTVIARYEFAKNTDVTGQFKRETTFSGVNEETGKSFLYSSQLSQKIQLSKTLNFEYDFLQKWNNFSMNYNYLYHVGIQFRIYKNLSLLTEQDWFHCLEGSLYQLDNSMPGTLGYMVYSGIGEMFNAVAKIKFGKHVFLNVKLQKMQKMNVKNTTEIDGTSSYHRIFVQIKFQ